MAMILALMMCVFPLTAQAAPTEMLTLDDVYELSEKGDALTLRDLDGFYGVDIGSGLIVQEYPLDGGDCMMLIVGATGMDHPVMYARLFKQGLPGVHLDADDPPLYVDIRSGDIDAYLKGDTAGPLVEACLDIIQVSPAWSSNTWEYTAAHPEECNKIRALSYHALPALSSILESQDVGLRGLLAGIFADEIVTNRVVSSFATPETSAIEARARAALIAYTGQKYVPSFAGSMSRLTLKDEEGKPVVSLCRQANFSERGARSGTLIELYGDKSLEIYALGMMEDSDEPVLMYAGSATDEEYETVERILNDGGFFDLPERIETGVLDGDTVTLSASTTEGVHTVSAYSPDGTPFGEIVQGIEALLSVHENQAGE